MPRFEPFPGLRYDSALAPLAEVIAPPYDVVDDAERAQLAARSPYNSVLVELPAPDDDKGLDRYANVANLLAAWEQEGVIRRDDTPSFYVYRMRYSTDDGKERSTTGVIGALAVDAAGGGDVLPHERTMPKPKGDRLDLLRACKANVSPIWGLSLTEGLTKASLEAIANREPMVATDDDGIIHELWPVTDADAIATITALVATTPVVIADGHHRYETANFYRAERRGANDDQPGAYDAVMALIVELTADELFVQPIHRLVSGLPADFDLVEALGASFAIRPGPSDPIELSSEITAAGGLGLITESGSYVLVPSEEVEAVAEAALDSSRLDVALATLPAHEVVYQHGARLAAGAVEAGRAQAAFLLRPATVDQIAETAHSGRRMPPKTTFFHPKPRTGTAFRTVPG